jgi:hypothetical protein
MSKADDGARLLRFILADGPLPSRTGRTAWAQNGWPTNSEWLLTAALRKAGITPEHTGHPGVAQSWWWRAPSDTRPIGGETRTHECTACRKVLQLPEPRYCVSTPRCPGNYQPAPQLTQLIQPTGNTHRALNAQIDLEAWKSSPSPLRSRAVTRRNVQNPARSWR